MYFPLLQVALYPPMRRFLPLFIALLVTAQIVIIWMDDMPSVVPTTITAQQPQANRTTTPTQQPLSNANKDQQLVNSTSERASTKNQLPPNVPAASNIALWQADAFEPAASKQPSQWIAQATSLGIFRMDPGFIASLQVGTIIQIPLDPPIEYRLTETVPVADAPGENILATMVNNQGDDLDNHGVITQTPELLLMTFHTSLGTYYVQTTDLQYAELSYVSKEQLRASER